MKLIKTVLGLVLFFSAISSLIAQSLIKIGDNEGVTLGPQLEYYVDSTNSLTIDEVQDLSFERSNAKILNLANLSFNAWVRFDIESQTEEEIYLTLDNALLEEIVVYIISDGEVTNHFEGSFLTPFKNRPIQSENFQFKLPLTPGTKSSIYLKVHSKFPLLLPIEISTYKVFSQNNQEHNLFWGLYAGTILFAFLYNLFVYFSIRERRYLYYLLYILGSVIFYMGLQGYSFQFLWPNHPILNIRLGFLICITNIIITVFTMNFLRITKEQKVIYYIGISTIIAYGLISIMNFTPAYPIGLGLSQLLSLITCIYFIVVAIISYTRGIQSAKYYLIGWSIFLVLVVVYILTINGVISGNFFTTHSIFIGHMSEVLLLSFALADQINILKKENELNQKKIIAQLEENEKLQIKVNLELEEKVHERTAEVVRQKNEAEYQRQRSDELLLNILPAETAEELKNTGKAKAKLISEVTVIFADIQDFTHLSETMSPSDLVKEINECFSAFDKIMGKYNVEKIKTIGDSYMAAGGLPIPNQTHARDVVNAGLEIQEYLTTYKKRKIANGESPFEMRIGIHTGPVVAGIVGIKKFAYDIWGDTVNLASRMESSGEIGKVNISEATYNYVKEEFKCTYRGKIEAKNKGIIDMYFVERL